MKIHFEIKINIQTEIKKRVMKETECILRKTCAAGEPIFVLEWTETCIFAFLVKNVDCKLVDPSNKTPN